eukprot:6195325-Pleurochrysis_carterae.AAC.1
MINVRESALAVSHQLFFEAAWKWVRAGSGVGMGVARGDGISGCQRRRALCLGFSTSRATVHVGVAPGVEVMSGRQLAASSLSSIPLDLRHLRRVQVLGIDADADDKELTAAYREAARRTHPGAA